MTRNFDFILTVTVILTITTVSSHRDWYSERLVEEADEVVLRGKWRGKRGRREDVREEENEGEDIIREREKGKGLEIDVDDEEDLDTVMVVTPLGKDTTLHCPTTTQTVTIIWVRRDTNQVLSYHRDILVSDKRLSITPEYGNTDWILSIKNLTRLDEGVYVCQINSKPPVKLATKLNIVVPPKFVESGTSEHLTVDSGDDVRLVCEASGVPRPNMTWQRVDGRLIGLHADVGDKTGPIYIFRGDELVMTNVNRHQMGTYQCVASNGVVPSISRRIELRVNFEAIVSYPEQVYAKLGTDVSVSCEVTAYPLATGYWYFNGRMLRDEPGQYKTQTLTVGMSKVSLVLLIYNVNEDDFGQYACIVTNGPENKNKKGAIKLSDLNNHPSVLGATSARKTSSNRRQGPGDIEVSDDAGKSHTTRHGHGDGPQSEARTANGKKHSNKYPDDITSTGEEVRLTGSKDTRASSTTSGTTASQILEPHHTVFMSYLISYLIQRFLHRSCSPYTFFIAKP